uniref:Ghrelin and obestatin prepropeptide n=1 Tax=Capra hircus TaxID=9925 RepID=A0A452F3H2_CAPHI
MPAPRTICSLLLLSMLWMDLAMAGSSFLSPEHQKLQKPWLTSDRPWDQPPVRSPALRSSHLASGTLPRPQAALRGTSLGGE